MAVIINEMRSFRLHIFSAEACMVTSKINIFGDSHSQYYNLTPKIKYHDPVLREVSTRNVNLCVSHGASIRGLGRKKSRLRLGELVKYSVSHDAFNVFAFGQVDIELGYYYRRLFRNEQQSLSSFCCGLADDYFAFIKNLGLAPDSCV